MSNAPVMASTYLEWAKLCSQATYNLATSGIMSYPLAELHVSPQDLEINGPTVYGYAPLQERLAQKCGVTPDCVVAAAGTSMANHLAMAALIEPGDDVLIEQPTYGPVLEVALYLRANVIRFERRVEQDFQIDPDDITRLITPKTRLICLTNMHNPSGALTSNETLIRIGEIAQSSGAQVLVDEVYLDMVYDQPPRSSFHLGSNFVVTTSLTKAYGLSGIRCGWILAQPDLAIRMWRLSDLFDGSPVHPGELLSVMALDQLGKIDARARTLLETNRKALDAFFSGRNDLDGFRSPWGTVCFPRLKNGSVDEFCEFLRAGYETSVVPGRFFEMPDHFRIGIGGDPTMTGEALKRLAAALDEWGTAGWKTNRS
ncbi:MAG: pyridoxal phosphate-dependent aminotransferase [Terracidiphilus sp.]|jgi:aspartate/methionine/tyrosine aminotransferase